MVRRSNFRPARRGFSSAEAITGIVVMSLAIVIVGRFSAGVSRGLHERELATRIGWQTETARAEVGAWSYDEITAENIKSRLAFSESLAEQLQSPEWMASVEEIEQPIPAKRIRLSLVCVYNEQVITPSELTFWVPKPTAKKQQDAASEEGSDES